MLDFRSIVVPFCGLLVLLFTVPPASAQVIQGTITDSESGEIIPDVEVLLHSIEGSTDHRVQTDSLGIFRIHATLPGRYTLELRHLAYTTQRTEEFVADRGEVITIEVALIAQILELEPLVVVERRRERDPRLARFYDRAARSQRGGLGKIYYHEDLRGYATIRTLVRIHRGRWTCTPTILVDGLPISDMNELDFIADLDRVEGVEVYSAEFQIPPEYDYLRACALMLIWTRPPVGGSSSARKMAVAVGVLIGLFLFVRR